MTTRTEGRSTWAPLQSVSWLAKQKGVREALERKKKKREGKNIRKKRSSRERERKKERKREKFNERRERNIIFFFFFFLGSCYIAQSFLVVHCSKKLKNFRYGTTTATCFLSISGAKNNNIAI